MVLFNFKNKKRDITPPIRKWSNDELRKISHLFTGDVVNVSGWKDKDKEGGCYRDYFKNKSNYFITNYEEGQRYNDSDLEEIILDLRMKLSEELINKFDVVFSHTTLEHIFDVRTAFRNLCLMSKDIVIVVVPFIQQQHEAPEYNFKDYWRFTPSCLRRLFKENGIVVIYEALNNEPDLINYLFFVGSKNSKKWKSKMPKYEKLTQICPWVS